METFKDILRIIWYLAWRWTLVTVAFFGFFWIIALIDEVL